MSVSAAPSTSLSSIVGRIAGVLGSDRFPTGERAVLRRMSPGGLLPLPFIRFALQYLPPHWDRNDDSIKDWATVVAGIALMSPGAHRPDVSLGTALGEKGYSEARLERLLSATGDTRRTLLLRAVRFLAAKSAACNWVDCVLLLQSPDGSHGRETLHRRIAADYYRVAAAKSS